MNTAVRIVADDETCWCGVPLDGHDDDYAVVGGANHRPDTVLTVDAEIDIEIARTQSVVAEMRETSAKFEQLHREMIGATK